MANRRYRPAERRCKSPASTRLPRKRCSRTAKSVGGQVETPPYDRAGVDRERILEVMLFYREAGGRRYTGLLNRYQQFLDLSGQLGLDRAILVGRGPPAARWTIDGQPIDPSLAAEPLTIYRFVIPVRPFSAAGASQ